MRIACIHLPSLPLQAFVRRAPGFLGAPIGIVGSPDGSRGVTAKSVVACSRAAWNLGVRPGMTALAARELVPGIVIAPDEGADAVRALGDALLSIGHGSPDGSRGRVDIGGAPSGAHHAIYVEVPQRTRGATFGARIVDVAAAQGLRVRVGIADDRFTAWVAASSDDQLDVVTVPRGGSAAFLAPLPLSLLAIAPEVQHVLEALGVRTLGEFAALPPPSPAVTATWDGDYQALARGEGAVRLAPHAPSGVVVEHVAIGGEVGLGGALERAARRVAGRLAGRGQAAAQLTVNGDVVELAAPIADAQDLADAVARALGALDAPTFVELAVPVAVPCVRTEAVPVPVTADASAPLAAASEPPVFRLEPPAPLLRMTAREPHLRTRKGKQRTRAQVAAQARLFRT